MSVDTSTHQDTTGFRVVQRTILRPDLEFDVRALYMEGVSVVAGNPGAMRQSGAAFGAESETAAHTEGSSGPTGYGHVDELGHATIGPEQRVTLCTYFNAFPASYWRRWTDFDEVRLVTRARGKGTIIVYRSTSKGDAIRVESIQVDSAEAQTDEVDLSLKPFIDGGWYWIDVEGGSSEDMVLEAADWGFRTDRTSSGRITIGITTFNRPDFCVDTLASLSRDERVLDIVDEIVVVDQGNQKVADNPEYPEVAEALGAKLRILDQKNLGGSGGFARAMSEAAAGGASDYVLLLDDDVVCELEGILRVVALADLAKQPVLVGGQMLSLYDRSVLHAFGETIGRYHWFWGPAPGTVRAHDFSRQSLRTTKWLHKRTDVDYNGWWMCLIPTNVVREIGLSMPMFIKWDDAEYGLRAQEAGYPTVTMPGAAVWHVPWTEKDDTLDWQAYFHERNRLTSALLHSPYERGGTLVKASLENHVVRLMSMQYSTGEIIMLALQDVLDGPGRMHRDISHRLGEVREMRKQYDDGSFEPTLDSYPTPRLKKPPRRGTLVPVPKRRVAKAKMAVVGLLRQVLPERELANEAPEAIVPHVDQRWYRLANFDSAIVSSADGLTASWHRRDRAEFRDQLRRSLKLHARLYREWPELAQRYREALPEITSAEAWKPTFDGYVED